MRRFSGGVGHWGEATDVRDDEAYFDGADKLALKDGGTGGEGAKMRMHVLRYIKRRQDKDCLSVPYADRKKRRGKEDNRIIRLVPASR